MRRRVALGLLFFTKYLRLDRPRHEDGVTHAEREAHVTRNGVMARYNEGSWVKSA